MAQKRHSKPVSVYMLLRDFARLILLKERAAKVAQAEGDKAPSDAEVIRRALETAAQIAGITEEDIRAKVAELSEQTDSEK